MEGPGWGSNQSHSRRATPQPWQRGIRAASVTYTIAHGNAGSLTHCVRPGIELVSSWVLVGFVTAELLGLSVLLWVGFFSCLEVSTSSEIIQMESFFFFLLGFSVLPSSPLNQVGFISCGREVRATCVFLPPSRHPRQHHRDVSPPPPLRGQAASSSTSFPCPWLASGSSRPSTGHILCTTSGLSVSGASG